MKTLQQSLVKSLCSFFVIILSIPLFGVSVYTIDHETYSNLNAFDIVNDEFVYRDSVTFPVHGWGGIDLAIDELTNTLFVSFEETGIVEIIDAQDLDNHSYVTIQGTSDITALLFDKQSRRLLATDRDSNYLHLIKWNSANRSLSLEETIQLDNIDYATDLAIHEDTLYVSEFNYGDEYYDHVKLYDMEDNFSYIETIDANDYLVSIDYNEEDDFLYGGAYTAQGTSYEYLLKYNMSDPNDIISKDIGKMVVGIAADDTTEGRVYFTAHDDVWTIEMWDTADWEDDPNIPLTLSATDVYDSSNIDGATVNKLSGIIVAEDDLPSLIDIVKVDDVDVSDDPNCVSPVSDDPNIVYTIGISSPIYDHNNIWIVDYLPKEVDFVSASPEDPNYGYDPYTHTYVWYLSSLDGYDINDPPADPNTYYTLTVKVNEWAEPASDIINEVSVESDTSDGFTSETTDVCCWTHTDGVIGVIYVDKDAVEDAGYMNFGGIETWWANGTNTGTCWTDAYRNLQDALDRAARGCEAEIWVADGTYYPGILEDDTFEIPDGVDVYGGFAGTETARGQRDFKKNKTILSGYINETNNNVDIVTMGDVTVLDGFIIQDAEQNGIYNENDEFIVSNCVIKDNTDFGIRCIDSDFSVLWCKVNGNGESGINATGTSSSVTIENSKINDNNYHGITCSQSTLTIKNSVISNNGSDGSSFYGINLYEPSGNPTIQNCTIAHNANEAINFYGSNDPNIRNCILFYNNDWEEQLSGYTTTYYCCVQDPNDPNSVSSSTYGIGNMKGNPDFAYDDEPYGYYHLNYGSICKDTGDPNLTIGANEVDMDDTDRDGDGYVDIGADEITCSDTSSIADWTFDGVVNMEEYAIFSASWLAEDTDDEFNPLCDLNDDDIVDVNDFIVFCDDWLWEACWKDSYSETMMMGMSMMGMDSMFIPEVSSFISTSSVSTTPEPVYKEIDVEQEYNNLVDIVDFLETIWLEDEAVRKEIKEKDWEKFMDTVYDWFLMVENSYLLYEKSQELESIRQ